MGTPDFAVASLHAITEAGHTVTGVVTAPDRPAGRGRKLRASAVKQYAMEHAIPVLQPTNLKRPEFIAALKALDGDVQVVVAFRMLPKVVWDLPPLGTFNLHASLLPEYRGAAPINWAIMNGEKRTGATTFFIDDKIDTGEIILQEPIAIAPTDTAGTLHDKLMQLGAGLVVRTLALLAEGKATTQKQASDAGLKTAHKLFKDSCKIDWDAPLDMIQNHVRGLSPYPVAWCYLVNGSQKSTLKVYRSTTEIVPHDYDTGFLIANKTALKVAVKEGYLHLNEVQLEGRKRMATKDLLNGLSLEKNAHVS